MFIIDTLTTAGMFLLESAVSLMYVLASVLLFPMAWVSGYDLPACSVCLWS